MYAQHQKRKQEAREEKSKDKVLAEENNTVTITMDVQAVRLSPYLNAGKFILKLNCVAIILQFSI